MKTHSPLIILALWLTALMISSFILYSCEKSDVRPGLGNCMKPQQDSTASAADTTAQN